MSNRVGLKFGLATLLNIVSPLAIMVAAPATIAQETSNIQAERYVSISGGSLENALLEIGSTFGVDIIMSGNLRPRKRVEALSGAMTIDRALAAVLKDTDLKVEKTETGTYLVTELKARKRSTPRRQSSDGYDEIAVEEIIVEGSKVGLSVQDFTSSTEVFTAERIEKEALYSLAEVIRRTANVVASGGATTLTIRGISRRGSAGQGQASNIYIDGVPVSETSLAGFHSIWDVGQAEVLRGPQSTLQGRNALAGAVVMRTASPSYEWEGKARLRVAEHGIRQYAAAISGPIIDDQLAFRISADREESDGFLTNAFNNELDNPSESLQVRGKLLLEPAAIERLSVNLTFEYTDREDAGASMVWLPVRVSDPTFSSFDPTGDETYRVDSQFIERDTYRGSIDLTYDLSDAFTFHALGTYEESSTHNVLSRNGAVGTDVVSSFFDTVTKVYTAEPRLEFDFGKLTGLVGGYYYNSELVADALSNNFIRHLVPFPLTPLNSIGGFERQGLIDVENISAFASLRYEMNDRWTFDFGFRVDDEKFTDVAEIQGITISPENCMAGVPGALLGLPVPFAEVPCQSLTSLLSVSDDPIQSDKWTVFLPRGSVTYHITDNHSVFVGARRGYRAGGAYLFNETNNIGSTSITRVDTYDPEFLTSFEAGWRTKWLDGHLTFNGTAFLSKYKGQQVSIPGPAGIASEARIVNAGKSTLYGLEMYADYKVSTSLDVYATVGLLETEFNEFPFALANNPNLSLSGNEFSHAPALTFTTGANYSHESGIFADASLSYQGGAESSIFNYGPDDLGAGLNERYGAVATVNARLGYKTDYFTITAYATNLFDAKEPTVVVLSNRNGVISGATGDDRFVNARFGKRPPQTFGVSLDFAF